MHGEQVVAEEALFLLTDPVGFENLLPALHARDYERHDRLVAW